MKTHRYIAAFVLCLLSLGTWSQDFARLAERSLTGTARYVGMGGAMTAIGGDPSAVHDNPAALGLYRRAEVLVSFDYSYDRTQQVGADAFWSKHLFHVPQASLVLSFSRDKMTDEGVQFNNLLFSYKRVHSFGRNMYGVNRDGGPSLGALLACTEVQWDIPFCHEPKNNGYDLMLNENGHVDEFVADWSMNISNRVFVGAGLHIMSYMLSSTGSYKETFAGLFSDDGKPYSNENRSELILNGAGCALSMGAIWRPLGWLRLGLGMQSPTLGSVNTYTDGELWAQTDSLRPSYAGEARMPSERYRLPAHLSLSTAFQIGAYGLIALQYDFRHASYMDDVHSLRAGIEVIPVLGMYINAGYVYESTFKNREMSVGIDPTFVRQDTYFLQPRSSQYASFAIGYRGSFVLVQAAYQYRLQRQNLYAHENVPAFPMRSDTHRIVFTIGWHRN